MGKEQIKTGVVNILGEDYEINVANENEDTDLKECNGYCDDSVHKIMIRDDLMSRDKRCQDDMSKFANKTVRHEIIHAFMDESGVNGSEWCHDEILVDWLAVQLPKMVKAMKDYL